MRVLESVLILISSLVAVSSFCGVQDRPRAFSFGTAVSSSTSSRSLQQLQLQQQHRRPLTVCFSSNREDEIAKLEAQLRELKDEPVDDEEAVEAPRRKTVEEQRILEKVKGKDMLLSERELVDKNLFLSSESGDEGSQGLGILPTVVAAVGVAFFLFFFAQVPVGSDTMSRYSVQAGPTTSTSIDLGDINSDVTR